MRNRVARWWLRSKSDQRFNSEGYDSVDDLIRGWCLPASARDTLKRRERELGVRAPQDLVFECTKLAPVGGSAN